MKVTVIDSAICRTGYRRILVGLGVNEPEPFQGYGGFNGLSQSVVRLSSGEMLMAFNSGYHHASLPQPCDLAPDTLANWTRNGFPMGFDAPRGGRAMLIRSGDDGATWDTPELIIDTEENDAHPSIVELNDGTLICVFFTHANWYGYEDVPVGRKAMSRVGAIKSFDGGKTWQKDVCWLPSKFRVYERCYGGVLRMPDGCVMAATYASETGKGEELKAPVYLSDDKGDNWKCISVIESDSHDLDEPAIAVLPSGRLIMMARPDGAVFFSDDGGKRWSGPEDFGMKMYAPVLIVLQNGTVVCLFGSYGSGRGGFQVIFSIDEGQSWIGPAPDRGFPIDNSAYGYGHGCEMPDGSIYCVYYDRGVQQQRKTAVLATRFRIRKDKSGIDMLSIPEGEPFGPNLYDTSCLPSRIDSDAQDLR